MLGLRQRVENHPLVFFLSALFTGFVAGLGCYHGILEIAHLKVVREGDSVSRAQESEDLPERHRSAEDSRSSTSDTPVDSPTVPVNAVLTRAPENRPRREGQEQLVQGIHFRSPRCIRESDGCIGCSALATSPAEDKKISLWMSQDDRQSRLIDLDGNLHRARNSGFGPHRYSVGSPNATLVAGVPSRLVFEFCGTEEVTDSVRLFEFLVETGQRTFEVRFRDVPIT